jgi:putative polyhydroxyalkanoate system protein
MPNIDVSIPHQLSRAEARKRIEELIASMEQQYGSSAGSVEKNWNQDTLAFSVTAMGASLSGHAYVEDHAVRVEIPLPWPLAMFAGNVKQQIEQEGRKLLGPPS